MAGMARAELEKAEAQLPVLERELTLLLLPSDPRDEKNIIMEIRAGTGGEEAALFAGDLFRMYSRYAESQGWKLEILSSNETDLGGFKEIVFGMTGERVHSRMKFESGTHRVQRVPATEASGRIHTSAITVAVMPEADEVDIEIKPEDLRIDVFRSGGHGGQSVNTADSAVRLTHLPSGLVVSCQDERSQLKNKIKGMKVLRSRLYKREMERREAEEASTRRQQVGSGDRSGRIRTYNFPQNRVSDHRIGLTLYKLDQVMQGNLAELIEALIQDEERRKLEQVAAI
jgi:peptide chain release factor 1